MCNIQSLYLNNYEHEHEHTCILNGGSNPNPRLKYHGQGKFTYRSVYKDKLAKGASQRASSIKSGILNAPGSLKAFGDKRAEDAKDLAPWFYGILYSISIALLSFLIFIPAIGFIVVGLICFVLLKNKISYMKSL